MVGSDTPPPRHWRTKAKAAKERGRSVKRSRSLETKDWEEEEEEEEAAVADSSGVERW